MRLTATEDLSHIVTQTGSIWQQLDTASLFITGASGFFGRWLLDSLLWAQKELNLKTEVFLLVRSHSLPGVGKYLQNFSKSYGLNPRITLVEGELTSFRFPERCFTHIIHAAAETKPDLYQKQPIQMLTVLSEGTRRVLELAVKSKAEKFLYISSGAVYGKFPEGVEKVPESYLGKVNNLDYQEIYASGKIYAEHIACVYAANYNFNLTIARPFAFVGPHLSPDSHFAICNFLANAIRKTDIEVTGNGSPLRSYLYAADLAIWLWIILCKGVSGSAYNVGSDYGISIKELAYLVKDLVAPESEVKIQQKIKDKSNRSCYVPSIERARQELGLKVFIPLEEAIVKSFNWWKES